MAPSIEEITRRFQGILLNSLSTPPEARDIASDVPITAEGLALDSVALFEFVVGIENEFGVILDDQSLSLAHFDSLETLARVVQAKLSGQPAEQKSE